MVSLFILVSSTLDQSRLELTKASFRKYFLLQKHERSQDLSSEFPWDTRIPKRVENFILHKKMCKLINICVVFRIITLCRALGSISKVSLCVLRTSRPDLVVATPESLTFSAGAGAFIALYPSGNVNGSWILFSGSSSLLLLARFLDQAPHSSLRIHLPVPASQL